MARRLDANSAVPHYDGITKRDRRGQIQWTGKLALSPPHILAKPLKRRKATMYFVNSMSDLFHESLSNEDIAVVWGIMAACPQHTFQVLTKRPQRAAQWFEWLRQRAESERLTTFPEKSIEWHLGEVIGAAALSNVYTRQSNIAEWPLPNVWIGTSVENEDVIERIGHLVQVPARVRFLSCEPLLGPLNLQGQLDDIDWVIVGGESGPGARPMKPSWVERICETCMTSGTKFFFKQWGGVHKKRTGRQLHGRTYDEMPTP